MKKKYHPPKAEVTVITVNDVVMASAVRLTDTSLGVLMIDAVEIYK